MRKRILAMLLAVVLAAGLLPGTALAADSGKCGDNLTWSYSGGTLTISGTGPMYDYYYLEPAPWSGHREEIRTIVIGSGVTTIGGSAFQSCTALTGVTIPSSVTFINSHAFAYCGKLARLTVPGSVTSISSYVFAGTPWLESLGEFAVVNGILLAYQGDRAEVVIPENVTAIGEFALTDIPSLTSVTILDGVTGIGDFAFYGCDNLAKVTIPRSVTHIASSAFEFCRSLADVYYTGTEDQWDEIDVEYGNEPLYDAWIHWNTVPTFLDVSADAYYFNAVDWAVALGVTVGTGSNRFSPKKDCTEAEILTMLHRAEGKPSAPASHIAVASYYQDAVDWAWSMGMIDRSFDPDTPCTRASAVKFIWQAFGSEDDFRFYTFSDVPEGYAVPVSWAVAAGVTAGTGDGKFDPGKTCWREEIVTFLHRAYERTARV